ncbi:putative ABC transporter ATP-binding protein [Lachnospiraceae bacterium]|nr:putative ABC transporter ATP-binding protein [Lachnospiraceae bacterium]
MRSVEEEQALEELDQTLLMLILLRSYVKNGQAQEDMPRLSQEEMEQMSASVGDNTLLSMGIAYAKACEAEAGVDVDKRQMDYLWSEGGKMFLMAMLMLLASVGIGYLASKVGAGIGQGLRSSIFQKVVSFSNSEMDRFSTASLITRSTNDIQQIQMVTAILLRMILYAPIIGIGGIYKVAQTGAGMGWIIALAVIVIVGFVLLLVSVAMPKFKMMQKLVDGLNLVSREILTGLSVIRAFGREKREEERFDAANRSLMKTQLFTNRVMNLMMPGMMFVMYGVTLLIVWVSAHRIDAGTLQVGAMTAFITYAMQIVMSFLMLTMMSIMLPRAGVAAERIDEVLTTEVSIEEPKQPRTLTKHQGVVSFSHVYFRYREAKEDVLEDIDFTARPGEVTAIIGSTGCGKSTLVNLLPRFYDVTGGSITIDGEDIRTLPLKELRNEIGFVPQKGVLFSGTIASNLRFGNSDADDTLIREAAEIAQASDFIEEKNEGYESAIAQGGSNVSGGQKQRLAIARAIAKQPRIFIFDDSFSALDMKTDAKLRKALEQKVKDSTVIIVAQRISTILNADQILVLDDGKIAGRGTHEELLAGCEVYRQIAKSQLSAKELGIAEGEEEHHE